MPESFAGDDLSYRVGTHLFTRKQTSGQTCLPIKQR